jgi:membrane associated rhomboid family serine protease
MTWADLKREFRRALITLVAIVAVLWIVQLMNVTLFEGRLVEWGVQPRSVSGLPGIVVHPILHGSWAHLISNTIGFLMIGGLVLLREPRDFWTVFALATLIGGIGIWLVGRPGPHIGISGVIFGYFGYLLLTGVFDRKIGAFLLSILTFLIWGRLLLGLSPLQRGISWEGHLFGLAGGVAGAWLRARRRRGK